MMEAQAAQPQPPEEGPDPIAVMRQRSFLKLLVLAAIVGVVSSLVAWGFLEAIHQIQVGVYDNLPGTFGFDSTPSWWSLPFLVVAGLLVAFAIARMPGNGGHIPVRGLNATPTEPIDLPGVLLAALAGIGLGIVLGPEAPLIAVGGGLGFLLIRQAASDTPPEAQLIIAFSGVFAAVSFLFGSPVIAAVLLVEAAGLDKQRLPLILIPGLLASGIGSLLATGMGSWTGLDTSEIALGPISLPAFARPDAVDFLWTIPFAIAIALVVHVIFILGRRVEPAAIRRPFVVLPLVGVTVSLLAVVFAQITDKGADEILFSGEVQVAPLVEHAAAWSTGALAVLVALKGIAYGISLGSFRGGPVFPAIFLGAAGGIMAARLPGFDLTPAIAVGIGASVVAVLRLPLSATVLALVLTAGSGLGSSPLIIVGVVVAYLVVIELPQPPSEEDEQAPAAAGAGPPAAVT